jgi:hypothetical protein
MEAVESMEKPTMATKASTVTTRIRAMPERAL